MRGNEHLERRGGVLRSVRGYTRGSCRTAAEDRCPARPANQDAVPWRPEQNSIGESSCSSVALRSIRSSSTSSTTSWMRCVGAVDLVDDNDDAGGPAPARLLQHEARLRHGAFGGVHQQDNAVDHLEHALHLAAEVGVARGIDDVDLVRPCRCTAVFLARMVMPRSRSRSPESITRSTTCLIFAVHARPA